MIYIEKGLIYEEIRVDEFTGEQFFLTQDPDSLSLGFYEMQYNQ